MHLFSFGFFYSTLCSLDLFVGGRIFNFNSYIMFHSIIDKQLNCYEFGTIMSNVDIHVPTQVSETVSKLHIDGKTAY
jgi:hypothetical protein